MASLPVTLAYIAAIMADGLRFKQDLKQIRFGPYNLTQQRTCTGCGTVLAANTAPHLITDCYDVLQGQQA